MEKSTLERLEYLIKEKKKLANDLYNNELAKKLSKSSFDISLSMIRTMKEEEQQQRRIDFENGYVKAVSDLAKLFNIDKDEFELYDYEFQKIKESSLDYINNKLV
jgi:hypothetical protein